MSYNEKLQKLFDSSKHLNIYYEHDNLELLNTLILNENIESILVDELIYKKYKKQIENSEKVFISKQNLFDLNKNGYSKVLKNYFVFLREENIKKLMNLDEGIKSSIFFQEGSFRVFILDKDSSEENTEVFNDKNETMKMSKKLLKTYVFFNETFEYFDDIVYNNENYTWDEEPIKINPGRLFIILKNAAIKLATKGGGTFATKYIDSSSIQKAKTSKTFSNISDLISQPEKSKQKTVAKKVQEEEQEELDLDDLVEDEVEEVGNIINYDYFVVHGSGPGKIPRTDNESNNEGSTSEYKTKLHAFLKALLKKLIPDSELDERNTIMNTLLNEDTIDMYWVHCFTHKSKNPNNGENYETYEALGDKLMSYCFKSYLYKRYPMISDSQLNDLDTKVNSKEFQGKISQNIGLWDYLIHNGLDDTVPSIHEDLLESFCGCLDTILNSKVCIGVGSIIIYNMYKLLLQNYDFDIMATDCQKDLINPKTWITQLFEILGKKRNDTTITISKPISYNSKPKEWNKLVQKTEKLFESNGIQLNIKGQKMSTYGFEEVSEQDDSGVSTVNIILLPAGREELNKLILKYQLNLDIETLPMVLGTARHSTKSLAASRAYEQAKNKLEEVGFTKEVVSGLKYKIKILKSLGGDELKEERLYDKVESEYPDLKHVIICDVWESMNHKLVQLVVIRQNNKQNILYSLRSPSSEKQDIYTRLIDGYLAE